MNKKILIFYTSIGLGHQMIAENIGWHLERAGFTVQLADIGQVQKGKLSAVLINLHGLINKHLPFLWSWFYKSKIIYHLSSPFRLPLASRNFEATLKFIRDFNPDLVITVQTTASAVLAYLKSRQLYNKFWVIGFSDFHLHRFWLYDNCDYYLANIAAQKQEMVNLGLAPEKIAVCGIALKPIIKVDAMAVRLKLQIRPGQKVILVGIGSLGLGLNQKALGQLTAMANMKIIIVCGKNQALFQTLSAAYHSNPNVKVLGFYSPMDELYAIADIFVTKPGGLTTAEALRRHLPLVVTHFLPGQEELNIRYLLRKNLILALPKDLPAAIQAELSRHELKNRLADSVDVKQIAQDGTAVVTAISGLLHDV